MEEEKLRNDLLKWDRKHTDYLKRIYARHEHDSGFINSIIGLFLMENELGHATSWLLKHHIDNGRNFGQEEVDRIFEKIGEPTYWETQLHLLQILPNVPKTPKQMAMIEPHIRELLDAEKKFVKAAAYQAYLEIVKLFPELKNEFSTICQKALKKESASLKVKIRSVLLALQP